MKHFRIGCLILIVIILICLSYEPFLNLREGLTSLEKDNKTMQKCYDLEKDYNIVVDKTWGSAPFEAREEWTKNNCNTVVENIQKCSEWKDKYKVEVDRTWGSTPFPIREKWNNNNCNDAVRLHNPKGKTSDSKNSTVNTHSSAITNKFASDCSMIDSQNKSQMQQPSCQMQQNYTCNYNNKNPKGMDNTNNISFNATHTNKLNQLSCNCENIKKKKTSCNSDTDIDSDIDSDTDSDTDSDSDTKTKKCKKKKKRNNFVKQKSITGLFTDNGIPAAYPYQLVSNNN